ncbi:MAG: hypothetical protein K8R67_11260 [Desulfobacteraceae bacterium]|nr:hypothetical protein [Desulfobacteraceae bacterium]
MVKKNRKGQYIFYAPKIERFIGNHFEKSSIFFMIITILTFLFYKDDITIISVLFIFCFIISGMFIFIKIQQKFAYKIIVDSNSHNMQFHMYRSNDIIQINFHELSNIRVNGYVIFKLTDRNIFYKDIQNHKLFKCINRIKKIKWGVLCIVWGPNKRVRDKIKQG